VEVFIFFQIYFKLFYDFIRWNRILIGYYNRIKFRRKKIKKNKKILKEFKTIYALKFLLQFYLYAKVTLRYDLRVLYYIVVLGFLILKLRELRILFFKTYIYIYINFVNVGPHMWPGTQPTDQSNRVRAPQQIPSSGTYVSMIMMICK